MPQRSAPTASFTIDRLPRQPEPLAQPGAEELEVLRVVGAGEAEARRSRDRAVAAAARASAASQALTISASASSGRAALWMSAVPASPVPEHRALGVGHERVRLRVAAVDAEEKSAHALPLGRPEPVGQVDRGAPSRARRRAAPPARTWRTSGFAESARMPSRRVPFHAVSAASAWYSPSISTRPRTWRGKGRDGITSMPPAWQRPSTSTTRSSGKPGSAPPAFGMLTGCTSSLSLKIASITSIASSSSWMPPRERSGSSCGSSLCA